MLIIAGVWLVIQMILTSLYPASQYSFALGIALAIFGIIVAVQIGIYNKAKKEIPK